MQTASPIMMQRDEAERLKSLAQYEILDTLPDPALDEITRLAASFCRAPYAFLSFIDAGRVWFKSRIGFLSRQQPRAPSACQYAILEPNAMVIDDAAQDYRFAPSGIPLAATTYVRSYAAAPIFAPNGSVLGTLAVCSPEPNMFTREHGRTLEVLARQIITRLELYAKTNQAAHYSLETRVSTGKYYDIRLNSYYAAVRTVPVPQVAFGLGFTANHFSGMEHPAHTTFLVAPELRLAWNARLQLSSFYQYNTAANTGALNIRWSWEYRPLSFVYLVVNSNSHLKGAALREETAILKVSYIKQL